MKHERVTEELRELAALYALGALTQSEARSYEIHLQEKCPVCEVQVRRFQRVVAGIGLAAEEAPVPDYLRDLLLARIERIDNTRTHAPAPAEAIKSATAQDKSGPARTPASVLSQMPQSRSTFHIYFLIVIMAALGLLAFASWRAVRKENLQLARRLSAAEAEAENLRILLDVQNGRVEELNQIMTMIRNPATRIARLAGQPISPAISGAILWNGDQKLCLTIGYFPLEPEGKIYQLWFLTPTEKIPAGKLKVDPTGRTFTTVDIPPTILSPVEIAVTLEPDNGSAIPTMPIYATARIP